MIRQENQGIFNPNLEYPKRQKKAGDFESHQTSGIESVMDTAWLLESIPNTIPCPIIGVVFPTDPRIPHADHSPEIFVDVDDEELSEK